MRYGIALFSVCGVAAGAMLGVPQVSATPGTSGLQGAGLQMPHPGMIHKVDDDDDDGRTVRRRSVPGTYRVDDDDDDDNRRVRRYQRAPESRAGVKRSPSRVYVPRRGDDDDDD